MAKEFEVLDLNVAVVLIVNDGKILAVFNEKWGAYTLPMTKRQEWPKPGREEGMIAEDWVDAAIRARAEWVRGTSRDSPTFVTELPEYQQSDRDGQWKRYEFHVFRLDLVNLDLILSDKVDWLTPAEFLDLDRRPLSKTARDIVSGVQAATQLHNKPFP